MRRTYELGTKARLSMEEVNVGGQKTKQNKKRTKWRSRNVCCAVDCSNREGRDDVNFYKIPSGKKALGWE